MNRTCKIVKKHIIAFSEKTLPPEKHHQIKNHLSDCPSCRILIEDFSEAWHNLPQREKSYPPSAIWHDLLEKIRQYESIPDQKWIRSRLIKQFSSLAPVLGTILAIFLGTILGSPSPVAVSKPSTEDLKPVTQAEIYAARYFEDFMDFPRDSISEWHMTLTNDKKDTSP